MPKSWGTLPRTHDTQYTVTLPRGLAPTRVYAGYDAPLKSDERSFMLTLDLDWTHDAPQIKRAYQYVVGPRVGLLVPASHIRLVADPLPIQDPDVFDPTDNSFVCNVQFAPFVQET